MTKQPPPIDDVWLTLAMELDKLAGRRTWRPKPAQPEQPEYDPCLLEPPEPGDYECHADYKNALAIWEYETR